MKIIHTADLHIGSPLAFLSENDRKIRRVELLDSFKRLVMYAKENAIKYILLSGDIFDKDKVNKADKEYFYQIIEANPDLNFYYLRGNHDTNSALDKDNIKNLFLFNNDWKYYYIEDVCISGIEVSEKNINTIHQTLNLNKENYNIIMLHGDSKELIINKFKNKYIDYMALGHIHTYSSNVLDTRGNYVYSGCLEGRGFDELGEKGFVIIDTNEKKHTFIPFATRIVYEKIIDITETNSLYDAIEKIEEVTNEVPDKSLLKLIIKGTVKYDATDIESRLLVRLKSRFFYYEICNKTKKLLNLDEYKNDISLKGEVIRTIISKNIAEEDKNDILNYCLRLLNGEDIEL